MITSCMLPVQAFMRLVYVSALVFGDAASFLLPWKRVLKVTDAQVGIPFLSKLMILCNICIFFCKIHIGNLAI